MLIEWNGRVSSPCLALELREAVAGPEPLKGPAGNDKKCDAEKLSALGVFGVPGVPGVPGRSPSRPGHRFTLRSARHAL